MSTLLKPYIIAEMKLSVASRRGRRGLMYFFIVLFLCGAMGPFGFFSPGGLPAEESKKEPIRIGASLSLTGSYEETSRMIYDAYLLWEKEINERGGLLNRPVELIILDDKSDPFRAREIYRKLIEEEKADLVLSPYGTPITLSASEITEQHKMVMIACGAAGERIWKRGYRYIFGMYAPAKRYFIGFLDLIARQGLETVSIIYENNMFNTDAAIGAVASAHKFGITIKHLISFNYSSSNLEAIIEECKEDPPDALIFCTYPGAGYKFLRIMEKEQFKPKATAMTIIPVHPDFGKNAGGISENIFAPSQWEPVERIPFPGTQQFIHNFTRFAGREPSYHATSAYSSCLILENAVQAVRSLDHEKIRDFIISLDTVTALGRFKCDYTGKQIGHNPLIIQWQDGKKQIVYPPNLATAEPRL